MIAQALALTTGKMQTVIGSAKNAAMFLHTIQHI